MIRSIGKNLIFLGLALVYLSSSAASANVFIIGSNELHLEKLTQKEVQNLFLGKINKVNGEKVTLVDCDHTRKEFLSEYVGKSINHYLKTWIKKISANNSVRPPLVLKNCPEVIRYVARHQNAIGYVSVVPEGRMVKTLLSKL